MLSLGKLRYAGVHRVLVGALSDPDPEVRWRAAMVLSEFLCVLGSPPDPWDTETGPSPIEV